ncbi:MAG: hypothetical protein ACK415_04725 [Thermodesulfovibrionales bacterium]
MLIGYNTNVKYKGKTYHIQTEDSGPANPQIVTLLYHQGAILASKKTNYAHLMGQPDLEDKLRNLMKQQHREMIMELKRITGADGSSGSPCKGGEPESVNQGSVIEGQERSNIPDLESRQGQDYYGGEKEQNSDDTKGQKMSLDDILIDFITRRGRK